MKKYFALFLIAILLILSPNPCKKNDLRKFHRVGQAWIIYEVNENGITEKPLYQISFLERNDDYIRLKIESFDENEDALYLLPDYVSKISQYDNYLESVAIINNIVFTRYGSKIELSEKEAIVDLYHSKQYANNDYIYIRDLDLRLVDAQDKSLNVIYFSFNPTDERYRVYL